MEITTAEAMKRLGIGRTTLQKWIKEGKLKYTKQLNNRIMIDVKSIERFISTRLANINGISRRDI